MRCSPPVVASLATYFGERPLQIRMYDADEERLDLFDRLARLCFMTTKSTHNLVSTTDADEALEEAAFAIVQVGENCARKFLNMPPGEAEAVQRATNALVSRIPEEARVLSLLPQSLQLPRERYYRLDWPGQLTDEERRSVPLQTLRYLNSEEYVHQLLKDNERSPLKSWLNDPSTAELVSTV